MPDATDDRAGGVLVIGGAGFVGSHLVDRLIAEGSAVDVVDDLSTGSLANLADARAEAARLDASELHIHTLDACSGDLATMIAMRRPREIYHLALLPRHDDSPVVFGRSFTSMLAVLDAARRSGVAKIVVALPATALYGHPSGRELPAKEGALTPRGVRGVVAKAIVELLSAYREESGIEFTALAVATVYGPRQRPDGGVVASMVAAAAQRRSPHVTGDGRQTRDFVYVDDAVDALRTRWPAGERTRRQRRDRRADVAPPPVGARLARRPGADVRRGAGRRARPLRPLAGARPHPPRVVALDHPRRRSRRAALTAHLGAAIQVSSSRRSAAMIRPAASISARWENACGKFPRW